MKMFRGLPLMFLCASICHAQVATASWFKSKDLQADEAILRSAYETIHPGLYRYHSKAEIDGYFDDLHIQLDHDQTLPGAFLAFSEFAAKVRCGHTQANPFNQSQSITDMLFKSSPRLPFYFDWLDGTRGQEPRRMVVTRDFTPGQAVPRGTEVIGIDGEPAAKILATLLTVTRADGANDSKRIAQLAVNGDSEYETFDIYYPLFFPTKGPSVKLMIRKPDSRKNEEITATLLTFEQRIAPIKRREEQRRGGDGVLFEWSYLKDGSAYLRMPTWALYNSKWNWKDWLGEHIDAAADRIAPALIVDVRGNEGGEDIGNEIITHLIDAPLPLASFTRLVRYRKVPGNLTPYLDTWDNSFRDWGSSAVDLSQRWPTAPAAVSYLKLVRYDDGADGDALLPKGRRFRGRVFVLIDATNSSATFQFVQNVQLYHLGTLIGRTTGGSQRGINGGAFFFLRLPHSGIEMDLPIIGTFPAAPQPDAGVTPDIPVTLTVSDIASGHDPDLAAVAVALSQ